MLALVYFENGDTSVILALTGKKQQVEHVENEKGLKRWKGMYM